MLRSLLQISSVCLIVSLSGCSSQKETAPESRIVAHVDGTTISVDDFERSYVQHLIGTGGNDTYQARYSHLQSMTDNVLLADEARRRGLAKDSLYKSFEERSFKQALGARFFETMVVADLDPPSDAEIREAFVRTKDKIVVRHLFYRSKRQADEAYERLLSGISFIDEAQRCYNTSEFDSTAGFLGPVSYFSVDDAFAEKAFSMDVGEISEPVRSRVGYHIIRVEDIVRNPLVTESEFRTRQGGITDRLRIRQQRLAGDSFVLDYMNSLDVVVDPEGVAALQLAIKSIENRAGDTPVQLSDQLEVAPFDLGDLAESFNPNTVLANYSFDGEARTFTAGDYYFWLRDLPFQEASNRTAASVGRALRNEVFAEAAMDQGLEADPMVLHELDLATRTYLASALRVTLSSEPATEPDEQLLRSAFERLGLDRTRAWTGSFTVVTVPSYKMAEDVIDEIESGNKSLDDYPGALRYNNVDMTSVDKWGSHSVRLPVGEPKIVVLNDGEIGVVQVRSKTGVRSSFEDYRESLRSSLLPYVNEYHTVNRLRESQSVQVDSSLFELIMDLDSGIE